MASNFYPLRQWRQRDDIKEFFTGVTAAGSALTSKKASELSFSLVQNYLIRQGIRLGSDELSTVILSQEIQGMLAWGQWLITGKRIIDCTPELAQAFCRSDCGEMQIADLQLPYPCLYIRFPLSNEDAITYADGSIQFEGAYLIDGGDVGLRIVMCGRSLVPTTARGAWRERYDLRILAKHFNKPAHEAIQCALADDLDDLRASRQQLGTIASQVPTSSESFQALMDRMTQDHPAFEKALRLILNALAYMQFGNDAIEPGWPKEAPSKLTRQVDEGTPKEQERGRSKLWALGHVPILKLGGQFTRQFKHPAVGMKAHWRQGHWRQQAYGPHLSLRKLLWIFPTVVGASIASE